MADKVLIDRAVVQQALEALEAWDARDKWRITQDLRAALAQAEPVQAEPVQAEPVQELVQESALQAVAEKIGDQCAVWYGIGARDVEAVLREAARYGLVRAAQTEPVAWVDERAVSWLAGRRSKASAHVTTTLSAAKSLERPMALYTSPQQAEPERNFCPRCGKRLHGEGIHTCTPPQTKCEHCSSPLFAAVQCRVCGRKEAK